MFRRIRNWASSDDDAPANDSSQSNGSIWWSPSGGVIKMSDTEWSIDTKTVDPTVIMNELYVRAVEVESWPPSHDRKDQMDILAALMRPLAHLMIKQGLALPGGIRFLEIMSDDFLLEIKDTSVGERGDDGFRTYQHIFTISSDDENEPDSSALLELAPRQEWVDPRNSTWRDYEEFFFRDKSWYRETPQWRQVLRVCHAHWNLERAINETYYRRELDGVEPTIPLCRDQIAIAPQAKVALEMHEKFEYDYRTKEIERERKRWKRNGWGEYSGWEPILRPFTLPEHRGFKQLAIIYDKMKDFPSAIEVCQEALAVDWPGDWDVRIARYQKRLDAANKRPKKAAAVSGNVIVVNENPETIRPNFCNQCGSKLQSAGNFCAHCGARIDP